MLILFLRKVLFVCKIFYALAVGLNVIFIFTYFLQIFELGFEKKFLFHILDTGLVVGQSCVLFYFFKELSRAFRIEKNDRENILASFRKVAISLFFLGALDALRLGYNLFNDIAYGKLSEGYLNSGNSTVPAMKFIEENAAIFSAVSNYLIPKPMGVFSFLLGAIILSLIKINRTSSDSF